MAHLRLYGGNIAQDFLNEKEMPDQKVKEIFTKSHMEQSHVFFFKSVDCTLHIVALTVEQSHVRKGKLYIVEIFR